MLIFLLTIIAGVGTLAACAYYALCLAAIRQFSREMRTIRRSGFTPPVSILKPLCGADPHAYASLKSHCELDYPEFEIIFGVNDPHDVAIDIVRRLIAEFPQHRIELVICSEIFGSNLKVSNLIQMLPKARYDHIVVNDSDICVTPDYLRSVLNEFQDHRVGLVTCLYRGISGTTLGSRLEALGISTDFVPGVLSARRLEGGIHFGLGSTLAFNRNALAGIGGFEAIADYLGDDYELGKRMSDSGFKLALAPHIVDHYLPDYSFPNYLSHQLRWARTVRDSRPGGYAGLVFTFGLFWAVFTLTLTQAGWAWALFAVAVILRFAVALAGGIVLRDRNVVRNLWLIPLRDLIAIAVWAGSYTGRRIVWRGNQFTLENGKLRP